MLAYLFYFIQGGRMKRYIIDKNSDRIFSLPLPSALLVYLVTQKNLLHTNKINLKTKPNKQQH